MNGTHGQAKVIGEVAGKHGIMLTLRLWKKRSQSMCSRLPTYRSTVDWRERKEKEHTQDDRPCLNCEREKEKGTQTRRSTLPQLLAAYRIKMRVTVKYDEILKEAASFVLLH